MRYFSTNRESPHVSFGDAVLDGQPSDGGLYFPDTLPKYDTAEIAEILGLSEAEIAYRVIRPYVGGDIPDDQLQSICAETVDFPFPLVRLDDQVSTLELFHGPTLAFKDVGARFMSRCLSYLTRERDSKTVVIVATSGDTGGAVAAGFHGIENIEVVIIYPKGMVSRVQELQLTTLGGNVTTLELHGTFDDCQSIAKRALGDVELNGKAHITTANSINVARWLPQQFYYFYAIKQWTGEPPVISVPSGNFGNLAAGILANVTGLPVSKFIAACNANDVVPRYLQTQQIEPGPTIPTISNAMDVGNPSNFVRILELFEQQFPELAAKMSAVSITDEETAETMRAVYAQCNYILDPHGAVGYRALKQELAGDPDRQGIFLETAHPIKFDSVLDILGTQGPEPDGISALKEKQKVSIEIDNDYDSLKAYIESRL